MAAPRPQSAKPQVDLPRASSALPFGRSTTLPDQAQAREPPSVSLQRHGSAPELFAKSETSDGLRNRRTAVSASATTMTIGVNAQIWTEEIERRSHSYKGPRSSVVTEPTHPEQLRAILARENIKSLCASLDASYAPSMIDLRNNLPNLKKRFAEKPKPMPTSSQRPQYAQHHDQQTKDEKPTTPREAPIHQGSLWKLNKNGDVEIEKDWRKRKMYLFKNGDLCYKSCKGDKPKVEVVASSTELRMAHIFEVEAGCKPHAFEFRIKVQKTGQHTSKILAAESKGKYDDWMRFLTYVCCGNLVEADPKLGLALPGPPAASGRRTSALRRDPFSNSSYNTLVVQASGGEGRSAGWEPSPYRSRDSSESSSEDEKYEKSSSRTASKGAAPAETEAMNDTVAVSAIVAALEEEVGMRNKQRLMPVFYRLQDDGELNKGEMPVALDLLGFQNPNAELIEEVFSNLTTYNTLDHGEFAKFVKMFEDRQLQDHMEHFNHADTEGRGVVHESDLPQILGACKLSYAIDAVRELISEACEPSFPGITADGFKRLVSLLCVREGFSRQYLEKLRSVFKRFDRKGLGKMSTAELFSAVTWLAYPLDYYAKVTQIGAAVDTSASRQPSGSLSEFDFIVCLRKVREYDDSLVLQYLKKHDTNQNHRIDREELFTLLRNLGYMPDADAIDEALVDAGMDTHTELNRGELFSFLDIYRKREGLTREEITEIDAAFKRYDLDHSGTITAVHVGKLLRWMGYLTSWELQQKLVAEVDVDHSGQLRLLEIRKLVRKYREREIANLKKSFEDFDVQKGGVLRQWDCIQALHRLGCKVEPKDFKVVVDSDDSDIDDSEEEEEAERLINVHEFVQIATRIRQQVRLSYRDSAGYTEDEVASLEEAFKKYDADDSGDIDGKELKVLLEEVFPDFATSAKLRPQLLKVLKQETDTGGVIDFQEFLRLMRQFHDLRERDRIVREQQAVQITKFTLAEVESFRELFLGKEEEGERTKLTLSDTQRMIEAICPLRAPHVTELREIFKQICSEEEETTGKCVAHFPEFLFIMRKLLDINFADIMGRSAHLAPALGAEHARKSMCATSSRRERKTTMKKTASMDSRAPDALKRLEQRKRSDSQASDGDGMSRSRPSMSRSRQSTRRKSTQRSFVTQAQYVNLSLN